MEEHTNEEKIFLLLLELDNCLQGICDDPLSNREKNLADLSTKLFETLHKEYSTHSLFSKYKKDSIRALLLECVPEYFARKSSDTNHFVDYVYKYAHKQESSSQPELLVDDDSKLDYIGARQPVGDEEDEAWSEENREEVNKVVRDIMKRMPPNAYKMVSTYYDQYYEKLQRYHNDNVVAEREAKETTVELAMKWLGNQYDTAMVRVMLEQALKQFEWVRKKMTTK